ncbi:MAG: GNAT family N-acetyltransferase [Oscillibacter sp.]|nr:GNAT family N-acetyltransferase [Oscillibacter sp.]
MTVEIRPWTLADAADLARALSNKRVQDNLRDGLPFPYTEQDGRDYISAMLAADKNETFAFAVTAEGRVIGSIGVFRPGNIHRRTAELGYYIAEEYWGKGVMTSAVRQICAYVFANSDIIRIYAEPFSHNAASCRVLEKAGFRYEGTLLANAVKNGRVIDMRMYALLKTDTNEERRTLT